MLVTAAEQHFYDRAEKKWKKRMALSRDQSHPNWASIELSRFYAVLQLYFIEHATSGDFYWWEAKTEVAGGAIELLPMNTKAFEKLLFGKEWVGVALMDGLWEVRKKGAYVSVWPVLDEEADDA